MNKNEEDTDKSFETSQNLCEDHKCIDCDNKFARIEIFETQRLTTQNSESSHLYEECENVFVMRAN